MNIAKFWPWPFITLATLGLVASILVHVIALLGLPVPFGRAAWVLHVGIFVVWLPAVLVSMRLTADLKRKDFWRGALRGCPPWMTYVVGAFFVYAGLNFILFMLRVTDDPKNETIQFRGFSGHWMVFYSAAAAILYTSTRVAKHDHGRRCANGHALSPVAKYCEECGAPVVPERAA